MLLQVFLDGLDEFEVNDFKINKNFKIRISIIQQVIRIVENYFYVEIISLLELFRGVIFIVNN